MRFRLTSEETAGNFSVVEVSSFPGEGVSPHLHTDREELLYVLDGTVDFSSGSRIVRVGRGSLVFVERGELHGFRNVGSDTAWLLDVHSPGGFESLFEEAGVPATDSARPPAEPSDPDRLLPLLRKHGMEMPAS